MPVRCNRSIRVRVVFAGIRRVRAPDHVGRLPPVGKSARPAFRYAIESARSLRGGFKSEVQHLADY
jgi:hypothetical protein